MKKSIVTISTLMLFLAVSFTSCKNTESNVINAQEEVLDARVDLLESKNEATEALEKLKLEIYEKISDNNRKIRDLSLKEIKGTPDERKEFEARINELENKNEALKSKLDAYTSYEASSFEVLKNELKENSDALEVEFKKLEQ
ncbi:hypothetical protein [Flavobacterium sp.]|uniref:hypothetical protein n=1 Tax=Flavobacterium sp. TaxID=239 RepID=UPI00260FDA15|nr:hypothetical protein [Flavobacterium sp.]MDD3004904.1 hypothetical protein [Flavobacterium sp.]